MSDNDVRVFHRHLAETMTAEVQSWEGSEDVDGLERLGSTASQPVMLACFLAAIAARARDQVITGAMGRAPTPRPWPFLSSWTQPACKSSSTTRSSCCKSNAPQTDHP